MSKLTYNINRALRFITFRKRPYTSAVILAGGSGTRMNSDTPKQFITLCGMPLFMHSLLRFDECRYVDEIIVVTRKEDIERTSSAIKGHGVKKVTAVISGGETRQLSAFFGFEKISPKSKYIIIHDAARPLITSEVISDVISKAYAYSAASAVSRPVDTIKNTDSKNRIFETLDRSKLYAAQTPQAFKCDLYRAAVYTAMKNKTEVTDDNMLVESIGNVVYPVEVTGCNIKVTTPEDLTVAAAIIESRRRENMQ